MKFQLINSIDPVNKQNSSRSGGLGLKNSVKRLEILYKGNYKLNTHKLKEVYVVSMELQLELLEEQYMDSLQLTKPI